MITIPFLQPSQLVIILKVQHTTLPGERYLLQILEITVSVISDVSNTVVSTITVGTNPRGVAYNAGLAEIFVTNAGSNYVSGISDSSNTVVEAVGVGVVPRGITYDSALGKVFVANSGSATVSVLTQ